MANIVIELTEMSFPPLNEIPDDAAGPIRFTGRAWHSTNSFCGFTTWAPFSDTPNQMSGRIRDEAVAACGRDNVVVAANDKKYIFGGIQAL